MTVTLDDIKQVAHTYLLPFGVRLLVALSVFFIGRIVARLLIAAFDRVTERSRLDISLRKFLHDVIYAVLIVAVIIASLDSLGVETTAVVAVLGAAGLAVGLALQGSLSNFAAGVMLIVLRPYKVTDLVAIGKYVGRVDAIKVFHTVLITGDNREITIPNGQIIAAPIENLTVLGHRRVDLVVSVDQGTDLHRVKQLLDSVVQLDQRVRATPPSSIEVAEITETAIKLNLRPWTSVEHHAAVATDAMERIRDTLTEAGLKFSVTMQTPTA